MKVLLEDWIFGVGTGVDPGTALVGVCLYRVDSAC